MLPNNGVFLNGVLRHKLLNYPFASWSFISLDFLLLHTAHYDKNMVLPLLVFKTSEPTFSVFYLNFKQYVNMFYNSYYINNLGLILFQLPFSWGSRFRNFDFLDILLPHLDFCLITFFVIIIFLNQH